eukprot:XP_013996734.1 PREDICTED: receptor-type tyrosine-protein phosphatase F-like [Salmo salar]
MPGGSVNLTCVAVGSPMPYVKWIMGEIELTKEDEMPIGRNVLEVTNVKESANYSCVAISSLGQIEATAQVSVKGEGSKVTLFVCVCVCVSFTLFWLKGHISVSRAVFQLVWPYFS